MPGLFQQRYMEGHEIAFPEHFLQGVPIPAARFLHPGPVPGMAPAQAVHAQGPAQMGQQAADAAYPHDAHGFPGQFHLFSLGPDPPVPFPVLGVHLLQILGTGKDQGQGMFRHAPGIGPGSQHHRDPPLGAVVHRHIFKAHPRASQHLQVGAPAEHGFRTFFQPDNESISTFQKVIVVFFPV